MIACAAGYYINMVTFLKVVKNILIYNKIPVIIRIFLHNAADNKRLFLNFLKHEMRICSLFSVGQINLGMKRLALNALCVCSEYFHAFTRYNGKFTVMNLIKTICVRNHRHCVTPDHIKAVTLADKQRRFVFNGIHCIGVIGIDNRKRIRALKLRHKMLNRNRNTFIIICKFLKQLNNYLRVGIAAEINSAEVFFPQLRLVFDNSVVNKRKPFTVMRMRIYFRRFAVRCPACVTDSGISVQAFSAVRFINKIGKLAHSLFNGYFPVVVYCYSGGVVTSVFKL